MKQKSIDFCFCFIISSGFFFISLLLNSNIIFKNENLEIFWQVGSTPANGEAKGVKVNCTAKNPHDGNDYTKFAGRLGKSLALHGGAKTQGYIYEKACELIAENASDEGFYSLAA